ncbi:hypothetical protein GCM10010112_87630 [Actinoplanes lobatus]|uniref:Uncharacterized protein n=1 Tax=Actinoplanes lobatus TaxID=113568 RepID=A0A7W7HR79_9ACTN|nr:hypothetical protein [Actinoplanes lobatus]GGN96409.1 hypothetical protein GCM10010112_87630 [Actinoplanes lobatus]GIE45399.1 hypothetical protein Alo02nite_82970 [Actinoplanes lobatus]
MRLSRRRGTPGRNCIRHRAPHRDNDTHLRLYAPAGTPADTILSLVTLDHHTRDPDVRPEADL